MHIWQAIKMAAKSLWTNKLRSFLTMLGIIIGVMTVALLTSVAQGVSDAVVSSIRSQSTLTLIYNMSPSMTYSSASSIIKSQQPTDETADDYFEFAMMVASSAVVSSDLTGITDVNDFGLIFEKIDYTEEELEKMSIYEKQSALLKQKAQPLSATINLVDSNFADVYELEFQGSFPSSSDEILIDEEFLQTYLSGYSISEAIGTTISLGVTYYTQIAITVNDTLTDAEISSIVTFLSNSTTDTENPGLGLTIIQNDDGTNFVFENNVLTINVEFKTYYSNDNLKSYLYLLDAVSSHSSEENISVTDIYEKDKAATYKIVGVLTEDSDEEEGSSSTSSSSTSGSFTSMLSSATKGNCYVLLTDENLASCGISVSSVSDCVITCAYLRYNTETYMDESTTNLTVAFVVIGGFSYLTDFMIVSFSSVASIITSVMDILTTMLTVISAVSLVVGGIGIMNIMLVAVTERTREIGVRKAIGAKRSSILVQFLIEALMLSLVGGLIGLVISWIGVIIIGNVMGFAMSIPGWVIAMSLGFCTAIGLIFGMFPAVKAARKQPIDALRHD